MRSSETTIFRLLSSLESIPKGWLSVISVGVVLILGTIDYLTGFELSFSFFYLIPVTVAAWALGRTPGLVFSVFSAIVWLTSNILSGESFSNPLIGVWNSLIRFGFYAVVTILLAELRHVLKEERALANTDPLTGALNRRSFNEIVAKKMVLGAGNRVPYTMVYIDVDDFKRINDQFGHFAGDLVLKTIADTIQTHIRSTDSLARLGGDEFAILLADIDQGHARDIVERLHSSLCGKMNEKKWSVTFSMGVLTVLNPPESVEKLIGMTDAVMYDAKSKGKDAIRYSEYS